MYTTLNSEPENIEMKYRILKRSVEKRVNKGECSSECVLAVNGDFGEFGCGE